MPWCYARASYVEFVLAVREEAFAFSYGARKRAFAAQERAHHTSRPALQGRAKPSRWTAATRAIAMSANAMGLMPSGCRGISVERAAAFPIPILCYHSITDSRSLLGGGFAVSPSRFLSYICALSTNGYSTISVRDLLRARLGEIKLPDRAVVLTFDDGFSDLAQRVLRSAHAP